MDRNNKYYGIIENLVKNHRKFPGLEAILEDIIDDVYAHSKTIIESIKDDGVIDGYLNRVVSTSMITVPKKLNYHNELKHRSISEYSAPVKIEPAPVYTAQPVAAAPANIQTTSEETIVETSEEIIKNETDAIEELNIEGNEFETILTEESDIIEEPEEIKDSGILDEIEIVSEEKNNTTLVDKMINSITEDSLKENRLYEVEEPQEEITNFEENSYEDINSLTEDETVEESLLEEVPVNYSDVSDIENLGELEVEEDIEQEEISDINTEEEKLLNGDENLSDEEENLLNEDENLLNEEENILSYSDDESNTAETNIVEDNQETAFDIFETDDTESVEEDFLTNKSEEDNNIEILELSEPDTEEEQQFDTQEEDNIEEPLQTEDELIYDTSDEAELMEDVPDLQEFESSDSIGIEENEDELIIDSNNEANDTLESDDTDSNLVIFDDEEEHETKIEFKPGDYSRFNFSPNTKPENYDSETIVSKLLDLDNQEPNLNILKIFDLKYKQNLTIEEIMAELNVEKQDVIAALDKMVDLI